MRPLHLSKAEATKLVGIIQKGSVHSGVLVMRSLGMTLAYALTSPRRARYKWICDESDLKRQRLLEN